jgi:predicted Zn-dependent peptidase
VFYSGGLSKTEIEKLITKYFCDLPVGRKKQVKNLEYKTNNVTVYDEHISNTFYNRIYGYKGIDNIEPQNKVNLEVLEYLLSSGMTSILFNELREKHGLCYSCSFSSIFFKKNSLLIINTEINKKNLIKTKKVINNIIKKLNKKITNKQLDKIKSKIKVKHLRNDAVGLAKIYWLNYLYKIRVNSTEQYFELLNKITKSSLIEFSDFVFNKLPESEIIIHGKRKNQ